MKKEEILAMEAGRELDVLVAEHVMGWYDISLMTNTSNNFTNYQGITPGIYSRRKIKNYSTDISATWEVVEKMRESEYKYQFNQHMDKGSFTNVTPLIICRAALLAVMDS
jgi:hypothetical protein